MNISWRVKQDYITSNLVHFWYNYNLEVLGMRGYQVTYHYCSNFNTKSLNIKYGSRSQISSTMYGSHSQTTSTIYIASSILKAICAGIGFGSGTETIHVYMFLLSS